MQKCQDCGIEVDVLYVCRECEKTFCRNCSFRIWLNVNEGWGSEHRAQHNIFLCTEHYDAIVNKWGCGQRRDNEELTARTFNSGD